MNWIEFKYVCANDWVNDNNYVSSWWWLIIFDDCIELIDKLLYWLCLLYLIWF